MSEFCLNEKHALDMEYMMCNSTFWVTMGGVYEILAKENNFGILAVVFETIIMDSM